MLDHLLACAEGVGTKNDLWDRRAVTGLPNSGYGILADRHPTDADREGMPDTWEARLSLDPDTASDANGDHDGTGNTNIEKYVNGRIGGTKSGLR